MIRMFDTHRIRAQQELTGSLWNFAVPGFPAQKVLVPSCWEMYPGFENHRGTAVYSTTFRAAGTIRLEFKGVSHTAQIFVDHTLVAEHYNAFTPFDAVVKDLAAGEHLLEVHVDNSFSEASALHIPNDYMTYGGINRPVALEQLQTAYIKHIRFDCVFKDGVPCAHVRVLVCNLTDTCQELGISESISDTLHFTDAVTLQPNEEREITAEFECPEARAWCFEDPALYFLCAELTQNGRPIDDLIERVGFRTIGMDGRNILLNGRAVRIKGLCRHEEHPQYGCAIPPEAMACDLAILRDLGANSVRTSHYPNDERFLDLCDEYGLLVWEESHARALEEDQMKNPNFDRQSADCIREMIENHYNHPSIYLWGILNECMSQSEFGRTCYEKQLAQIRSMDHTRLCSFASCMFFNDICLDLPDVVSYNIYPQWYHDTPSREYLDSLYNWIQHDTAGAGKPFLISEVGAGAIYGFRSPAHVKWSEEYQQDALFDQLDAILSKPECSGVYIWQFCDGRVCPEWFAKRPRSMNNKGVVDEYRRPKLCYSTVKQLFTALENYR